MNIFNILKVCAFLFIISACQANTSNNKTGYADTAVRYKFNLENRESYSLPVELEEISGHTFIKGNDNIVYAIQDEEATIFAYNLKLNKIERTIHFGESGDYEGITNDGKFFYVLKSNGTIYSFPINEDLIASNVKVFKGLLSKGEYESLGIDTINHKLAVLCKRCNIDNNKQNTTGYILDYSGEGDLTKDKSFIIDYEVAQKIYPKFPKVFKPSSMTKNNNADEWYILSSIDKMILITDSNFRPISVIPFSRKLYEQPEGIAFDNKGNLYISSEKGDGHSGMLYKIK